ncbi:MAG: hypothetical protein ACYTBJ_23640 [Planctomycetota bacterium]|jgi:hypothetical protein
MKAISFKAIIRKYVVLLSVVCLFVPASAHAQSGGPYVLEWSTIDGGGGQSSGGAYVLTGTIGQPDAAYSSEGNYEILGGFWPGGSLCFVEFDDFARFADYWLATGAGLPADLYEDGAIDWHDLREFAYEWLYECPHGWPLR